MLVERKEFVDTNTNDIGYVESVFDSSNILKTTYFPKDERLYLSFNKGQTYSYGNVSKELYEQFEKAESQGKFFIQNIKKHPDKHPYRKEFTLYPNEIQDLMEVVETNKKKLNEDEDE